MGFIFFLMIIGFAVFMWTKNSKTNQTQWQQAADQLNLAYYAGGFGSMGTISGSLYGHRVAISTFTKGSGNTNQVFTKYHIEYCDRIRVDMNMTRQGALHSLGKVFGMQDIEIGDPGFDDRIILRGSDPAAIRRFITPDIRDAIKLLVASHEDVTITNDHVCVMKKGKDTDSAVIVSTTKRLLKFCDKMNAASRVAHPRENEVILDKHPSAEPIIEVPQPPEIPAVEPPYDPYSTPNPVVPEPPMIPVVDDAIGETAEPAPDDGEIAVAVESPLLVEPEPVVPAKEPEPKEEPVDRSVPVDLQATARELFGDSGHSLLSSKLFDEKFKDRPVEGSGVVRRVAKFSYDPVFVNAKGVKVALTVCEFPGTYSKIKVTAEVMYPPGEYDTLKPMVGATLPINGTLFAQDAMMNALYIKQG